MHTCEDVRVCVLLEGVGGVGGGMQKQIKINFFNKGCFPVNFAKFPIICIF